ncbi:sodium-solute symporter [Nonlabens ulvanivorans]|uniref:Sodium-solute symporter n=2 Tax=Nonlabens ulvanivorans TaxID=906888 RepID=A0A090WHK8_NONUL|nr:sodium-solute symporter [Nonlabens ulvanivorans]
MIFFADSRLDTQLFANWAGYEKICFNVVITTTAWLIATFATRPTQAETLDHFNHVIFGKESKFHNFPIKILGFFMGIIGVYSLLFSIGKFLYGDVAMGTSLMGLFIICVLGLIALRKKLF